MSSVNAAGNGAALKEFLRGVGIKTAVNARFEYGRRQA
jgi:hypothetical protein